MKKQELGAKFYLCVLMGLIQSQLFDYSIELGAWWLDETICMVFETFNDKYCIPSGSGRGAL